ECVEYVKGLLGSMDDGRITVSPYDTAWVSLIADEDDGPRFPASLEWISRNQLPDGSWGDGAFFLAYDRLLNTLACVVALKFWNLHPRQVRKGASFIRDNMRKLEEAEPEHMTCGFELVFPSLLQRAQRLGIDGIPYDHPAVRSIFSVRDHKMKR
ncbi:copalyl diphosphate synthase, partial [Genlisea aurea]